MQEMNRTVQEAKRTMQKAYHSVHETNRTVQETNRTVQEAYRTMQKAYRTVQKSYRTMQSVQDNLYANPAPKSEPYSTDYHVTFISRPSHNFTLIMNDVTRCKIT
jgi:SMC interacting uncharacterized protein involved in chromosome segregation